MRIAICSDTSIREVNGIARVIVSMTEELTALGHHIITVTPDDFPFLTLPYGDRLAFPWYPKLSSALRRFGPDIVWIQTQAPLAISARIWCRKNRIPSLLSFHTRFPDYMEIRFGIPKQLLNTYIRLFLRTETPALVASETFAAELRSLGARNVELLKYGVDLEDFRPGSKARTTFSRPLLVYVGRVAAEKNVEAFLNVTVAGTKAVVGDGPQLEELKSKHTEAIFTGNLRGAELASWYGTADVVVFPSLLDTFGLSILEALASGVPVAALPSPPISDNFGTSGVVAIDCDLSTAIERALKINPEECRNFASQFSWRRSALRFLDIAEKQVARFHERS